MNLVSIRIATDDVPRLVGFYEKLTGLRPEWANDQFAELVTDGAAIAISSRQLTDRFAAASVEPAANHAMMIELLIPDVDAVRDAVAELAGGLVMEPTTLPWGNRSLLVKDPDGNVVNLFTPVTMEAQAKFGAR
ncbi:VOC family protein [Spongisporangium articulatum]|uniref:VOC family protein n=1 Tax=Spongisporangium articulatum TaxID=3362603 RepID=A0ABW8AGL5_9ACTN